MVSAALRMVDDIAPDSVLRRTEIALRDVSVSYQSGKEGRKTVLSRLNLKVAAGEFVG